MCIVAWPTGVWIEATRKEGYALGGISLPCKTIVEDKIRTLRRMDYGEEEI